MLLVENGIHRREGGRRWGKVMEAKDAPKVEMAGGGAEEGFFFSFFRSKAIVKR